MLRKSGGFELRELGKLRELGNELSILNLLTVSSKREAADAKLKKRNLKELISEPNSHLFSRLESIELVG